MLLWVTVLCSASTEQEEQILQSLELLNRLYRVVEWVKIRLGDLCSSPFSQAVEMFKGQITAWRDSWLEKNGKFLDQHKEFVRATRERWTDPEKDYQ